MQLSARSYCHIRAVSHSTKSKLTRVLKVAVVSNILEVNTMYPRIVLICAAFLTVPEAWGLMTSRAPTSFPSGRAYRASILNAGKRPPPPPRPGAQGTPATPNGAATKPKKEPGSRDSATDDSPATAASADVVKIRFINGPGGKDLVHLSKRGANLMKEADLAGLYISRGCKSGLCGACMADLKDPSFVAGDNEATNNAAGRAGFQAIKACSTKVQLLPGQKEMVIDLWRMKDSGAGAKGEADPMARFGEVNFESALEGMKCVVSLHKTFVRGITLNDCVRLQYFARMKVRNIVN